MGWLTPIMGVLRTKWVPYVAILWATSVGGVSLWSYMEGKAAAERKFAKQVNNTLREQLSEMDRVKTADLKTLARTVAKEQGVKHDIGQITFPEMDEHCRDAMYDWMRSFNDAVHATGSNTE